MRGRDLWRVTTSHVLSFVLISILRGQPRTPPSGDNLVVLNYYLKITHAPPNLAAIAVRNDFREGSSQYSVLKYSIKLKEIHTYMKRNSTSRHRPRPACPRHNRPTDVWGAVCNIHAFVDRSNFVETEV